MSLHHLLYLVALMNSLSNPIKFIILSLSFLIYKMGREQK